MKIIILLTTLFAFLSLSAQDLTGTWSGVLDMKVMKMPLVFNITKTDNVYAATLDSPHQGAKGIPMSEISVEETKLSIKGDAFKMTYDGELVGDSIKGTFQQAGNQFPLNLGRGGEIIKPNRPQEPQLPFLYHSEDVVFDNKKDNIKLSGTFTYPTIGNNFPVVVLIAGSGPNNRNEEIMGHKPFLVLSNYLTNNGIAVLRYDKRGVGKSGGVYDGNVTTKDFAHDAICAVEYLKNRNEINPSQIGLIGHSEGGSIGLMLASEYPDDISFLVSMAGMGASGRDVVKYQSKQALLSAGVDESVALQNQEVALNMIDIVINNSQEELFQNLDVILNNTMPQYKIAPKEMQETIKQQLIQTSTPWWRALLSYDARADMQKIKCPVFALNGALDMQVEASENLRIIDANLINSKSKKIKEYPQLNHLFQTAQTGSVSEYVTIEETIAPEVLKDIADWIKLQIK